MVSPQKTLSRGLLSPAGAAAHNISASMSALGSTHAQRTEALAESHRRRMHEHIALNNTSLERPLHEEEVTNYDILIAQQELKKK